MSKRARHFAAQSRPTSQMTPVATMPAMGMTQVSQGGNSRPEGSEICIIDRPDDRECQGRDSRQT